MVGSVLRLKPGAAAGGAGRAALMSPRVSVSERIWPSSTSMRASWADWRHSTPLSLASILLSMSFQLLVKVFVSVATEFWTLARAAKHALL
eukprot:2512915-Pyramimonas_sp.AAC.1